MVKPTAQACHALTTYFMNAYLEVVEKQPVVNRNKSRWGFEAILMDYTPAQAKVMIDFYLEHYDNPSVEWFLFNYEKVDVAIQEHEKNKQSASKRRKETEERLKLWMEKKDKWQNQKH